MKIAIFGVSGFAREVADVCLETGYTEIVFIDYITKETEYFGFPLIGENEVARLVAGEFHFIIGVGDNKLRKEIYHKFPTVNYINLIHPSATFGHKQLARLKQGIGNIVTAGTRITSNIEFGNFGIFNLNCTIGHDCIIEDFVTVSPGANISGNVHLSEGAYIGTGAQIIQGKSIDNKLSIGKYSTVGAGAVVTKSVPAEVVVRGVPAR